MWRSCPTLVGLIRCYSELESFATIAMDNEGDFGDEGFAFSGNAHSHVEVGLADGADVGVRFGVMWCGVAWCGLVCGVWCASVL